MEHLGERDSRLHGIYWVEDAPACSGVYILDNGRTLVDAGNMYGLIDEVQDLIPAEKIERVLLTHSHFDHIGGLAEIFQYAVPDLYINKLARAYLDLHNPPFPEFFAAVEKDGKLKFLEDGEYISGDHQMQVIHTPGHTAGDICFYVEKAKTLFSGDAVIGSGQKQAILLTKPDEVCGGRIKDKVASLKRILGLDVDNLLPGHGKPVLGKGLDQVKISLMETFKVLVGEKMQDAWTMMAETLMEYGQTDEVLQCCKQALKIDKENSKAKELIEELEVL